MGLKHTKQKDERKRKDKATGRDIVTKRSSKRLDGKTKCLSSDTGVGLSKATDKAKVKSAGPDSMKMGSHEEPIIGHEFISPSAVHSVQMENTARPFKPETDSLDEAEYQVNFSDSLAIRRYNHKAASFRTYEWTSKARPFNPENESSEEADIPDPDETQPKTALPHPIQDTRPPGDIYLLGYQCLRSSVRRNQDVKYVSPIHQQNVDFAIWNLIHDDHDSQLKKHALIHLSHQLSRQLLGINKDGNFIVWPGTNIETGQTCFICLHKAPLKERLKSYFGIEIYYKDSEKLERSIEFPLTRKLQKIERITYWDASFIQQAIEKHGDNLFRKHSNLEAISGSPFAISSSEGLLDCQVVVLYCRVKGFKPYGEDSFPKSLQVGDKSIQVDVREGIFRKCMKGKTDWHKILCMGISIGIQSNDAVAGTLGPFVQVNEVEKGFLTCAHVVKPSDLKAKEHFIVCNGPDVLQPAEGELLPNQRKSFQEACCGRVLRYIFNPHFHDPSNGLTKYVGVDAALVKVTNRDADVNNFPFIPLTDLKKAGFDPQNPPVFKFQSTKYPLDFKKVEGKRVIKHGRTTGLTKGSMLLDGAMVKVHDSELELPSKSKVVMMGQYIVEKHGSTTFFDLGDSGSGVFMIDEENNLTCIGLAIGLLDEQHDLQCVVTPIEYVLKALGLSLDSLQIHETMDIGE